MLFRSLPINPPPEAQRDSGGGFIGSGDGGRGPADEFAPGAVEVCTTAIGRGHAICGGDGFAAGSEPGAELADGAAGICGSG